MSSDDTQDLAADSSRSAEEIVERRSRSRAELLAIFDTSSERAEEKYLKLYYRLVRYFEWNRKCDPEDLAQEAIRRGLTRLQQGQTITVENPESYFFGVARNLIRESWSARQEEPWENQEEPLRTRPFYSLNESEQLVLLKEILSELPDEELGMLMAYIQGKGDAWARKKGIQPASLRSRVHRLRERLEALIMLKRA
jgi:DNA-directed RNA polymerase specialized sigma24 family protein